jgi:2-amino-4,5-dihydroxy-6-oxo-7-(phosphonooxy)heptanoate synthase
MLNVSFGRRVRTRRLHRHQQGRLLVVPLDHSITNGPVTGGRRVNRLVGQVAAGGADAVVLHKGAVRYVDPSWFDQMSLIIHLSAGTVHAPDPDYKYLVASVEESLRLGADAVSVHVNLGSESEDRQIRALADVAAECDLLNVPLMAMVYPRGPRIGAADPDVIAHAAVLAADLGADIIKTVHPGTAESMTRVCEACPMPVVVAGGARRRGAELRDYVLTALSGGAAGIAAGRNVFESSDPRSVVAELSRLVHHDQRDQLESHLEAVKRLDPITERNINEDLLAGSA